MFVWHILAAPFLLIGSVVLAWTVTVIILADKRGTLDHFDDLQKPMELRLQKSSMLQSISRSASDKPSGETVRHFYLALTVFFFYMAYSTIANATETTADDYTIQSKASQKAEAWADYRKSQTCNKEGMRKLRRLVRYSNTLWETQMASDKLHECEKFLQGN